MKNIYKSTFRLSIRQPQNVASKGQLKTSQLQSKSNSLNQIKIDKAQIAYTFEIDKIQDKIRKAKNAIYNDLALRFEGKPLLKPQAVSNKTQQASKPNEQQTAKQSDQLYKFDKKRFTDVPKINLLMNATTSIQFDPQSIKYEYQENVQTLVQNIFSQETEKNLKKKEKTLTKTVLDGSKLQSDLIDNLLMLYGLRKQQQLQENLSDPLQKILSTNKMTQRKILKYLADLINRMSYRKNYYQQILMYLPLQQVIKVTSIVSLIKKIEIVSWIIKNKTLMEISEFILQNKQVQKGFENMNSLSKSKFAEEQESLKNLLAVQLWILKVLENFVLSFQKQQFTKQAITSVCQNLSIYQKTKHKLQAIVEKKNLDKSMTHRTQSLKSQSRQELLRLEQLLEHKEEEQFYQKVFQIILFLDNKKQNKDQEIQIYHSIFKILLEFEDIKIPNHIFQKVIDDHMTAFKKLYSFETVSENYIQLFTQFVVRNLEVSITNEYALVIIKIIWLHNLQRYRKVEEMTFNQGKYFVMALHIISSYFKRLHKIERQVINHELLIEILQKYATMIHKYRKQFNTLNKKVVLELLQKALTQLFEKNREKDTALNMLQEIRMLAQNSKS